MELAACRGQDRKRWPANQILDRQRSRQDSKKRLTRSCREVAKFELRPEFFWISMPVLAFRPTLHETINLSLMPKLALGSKKTLVSTRTVPSLVRAIA